MNKLVLQAQALGRRFHEGVIDVTVLQGIDLQVQSGQTLAVVGASGGGKSTLAALLPRFMSPTQGHVLIDGIDAQDFSLVSLRKHMSLVTQEVLLFNDTIAANIAYGHAHPDRAAVEKAAKAANAWDFITAQPLGLDTLVGEAGMRLSGGQRQRISIARAIYKNAPILILDEATSALDAESDRSVQAALANLMQGRTCVVIAHRLSTLNKADRLVVMEQGVVVEEGDHDTLMARQGAYYRLYEAQAKNAEDAVTRASTKESV
jgi:subfamily B ATP-binding cassette protein MsbA